MLFKREQHQKFSPCMVNLVISETGERFTNFFRPNKLEASIDKVGRVASGDVPPFMTENGNVYNYGSHGFLARALSIMGKGEELFEVLKWLMPFDTHKHPTALTYTPPYAIVNCWQQLPGFHHRGLMCFLTGSVAMAMRGVYEWMFGIKPCLNGLETDLCMPKSIREADVSFIYQEKKHQLKFVNGKVLIDGSELKEKKRSLISDHDVWYCLEE